MTTVTTLADVARHAGVSITTASKAINGKKKIAPETRDRILAAVRELNYHPNPLARSLHSGRSGTVGMVLIDAATHRFVIPLIFGIEAELAEIDLSLILSDARGEVDRVGDLALTLRRRKVDGLIIVGDNNMPTPRVAKVVDGPVVYVHGTTGHGADVNDAPDDYGNARLATDHVVALGRSHIIHIAGPDGTRATVERARGFADAIASHGLRPATQTMHGPWSQRWGSGAIERLLADGIDFDAVVCGSDQIASGAIAALHAAGRSVPGDVAVTGYDNLDIFALETDPATTTVDPRLEELGAASARRLFGLIDGHTVEPGLALQSGRLLVRRSSDPSAPTP